MEVGASISCAANGTQWLREWEVDIPDMKPVILVRPVSGPLHLSNAQEYIPSDEASNARLGDWKDSEPIQLG